MSKTNLVEVKKDSAKEIFNFGLCGGVYGMGTEEEILELCKDFSTTIYNVDLANIKEVEEWVGYTGEPWTGLIATKDGVYQFVDELPLAITIAEEEGIFSDNSDFMDCFIGYRKIA